MTTVPVQLSESEVAKIDHLVALGRYKNRTQAIKALLQAAIQGEFIPFEWENSDEDLPSQQLVDKMLATSDLNFQVTSKKSAHELIGEDRERS